MSARIVGAVVICLLTYVSSARAQGDGGQLTIGGKTYRLWGLVAPTSATACLGDWKAGHAAQRLLERLTTGRTVDCEYRGTDRDGMTLALCRADGRDVGVDLVRAGLAWSNGSETHDYVLDEGMAMAGFQGVHAHGCRLPRQLIGRPPITPIAAQP